MTCVIHFGAFYIRYQGHFVAIVRNYSIRSLLDQVFKVVAYLPTLMSQLPVETPCLKGMDLTIEV